MTTYYPDTLVFQFTEIDADGDYDLQLYVVYDDDRDTFCVYGRRLDTNHRIYRPFSYEFETMGDVWKFMRVSVDKTHGKCNYALYSMHNLPSDINDFGYYLLDNFAKRSREVCAFDDEQIKSSRVYDYLEVISMPIMHNYN